MTTQAVASTNLGTNTHLSLGPLICYGAFGFPLALVALPIYVYVAKFYSDQFGLSLTLIGTILLATRLLDTFTDPLLGWWVDRSRLASTERGKIAGYRRFILYALPLLALGYLALFHPRLIASASGMASVWLAFSLVVVYLGFSLATITYQGWGAELSTDPVERTRITGTREGLGLVGVIIAAVLPEQLGMSALTTVFIVSLCSSAWLLLILAPHPVTAIARKQSSDISLGLRTSLTAPLGNPRFRMLLWIFLANGIASAIPANLILFFVRDVLQLVNSGLFLGAYFIAGACSIPLWIALAKRLGLARAWFVGMLASIAAFVWAYWLSAGDQTGFLIICIVSGFALGADLALPAAILAGVITAAGHRGSREGAYFGLWSFATKLNLALAAGISLPLLGLLGYVPQMPSITGAHALSIAYALVPCGLKLLAVGLLWRSSFFKESI